MRSEHNLSPEQLWISGLQRIASSNSLIANEVFEDINEVSTIANVMVGKPWGRDNKSGRVNWGVCMGGVCGVWVGCVGCGWGGVWVVCVWVCGCVSGGYGYY